VIERYNSDMPQDTDFEPDDTGEAARDDSTMIAAKAKVWFYDDDKTPEDFVLYVLEHFFGLDDPGARRVAAAMRQHGKAIAVEMPAIPAEIARRRVAAEAADSGYPLRVEVEGKQIV
jgi:ATP-dependent Clp protease adapter protein ClpS